MRPLLFTLLLVAFAATASPPAEEPVRGVNPRFLLEGPDGRAVSDESFRGHYLLIAFGYTHCPDICPTTLVEMAAVMQRLGERAERVQPLFITVDPERDSVEHLARYVTWFHPRLLGLGGPRKLVERAAFNYKVRYRKVHNPGDPPEHYAMDHSAGLYLVAPDGRFLTKFGYGEKPEVITETILRHLGKGEAPS